MQTQENPNNDYFSKRNQGAERCHNLSVISMAMRKERTLKSRKEVLGRFLGQNTLVFADSVDHD